MKNIVGLFSLLVLLSLPVLVATSAYADSCGGVQTSVISCTKQTGICPKGGPVNPWEGSNPGTDKTTADGLAAITAYKKTYGHDYGKCTNGSNPVADTKQSGIWGLLLLAINILTAGVGIAAVGGFVYAGILYTSSAGNPEQTKKAIEFIRNIVIGVVAYALMFAFLNFIIPGGLFG